MNKFVIQREYTFVILKKSNQILNHIIKLPYVNLLFLFQLLKSRI